MRWDVLREIGNDDARALLRLAHRRRFRKGEVVFHEGDPADSLHLIDVGHVAVRMTNLAGDVTTLWLFGPGDQVGELALVDPDRRSATVVAVTRLETVELRFADLDRFRADHPGVERVLLAMLARHVRRLSAHLQEAMYLPAPTRLVRRISELATMFDDGTIPLTQQDLAGLAGTTRQTVNQVLVELRDAGLVELARGCVRVVDPTALARRAR